jgi:hypothetical protein
MSCLCHPNIKEKLSVDFIWRDEEIVGRFCLEGMKKLSVDFVWRVFGGCFYYISIRPSILLRHYTYVPYHTYVRPLVLHVL